jgi:hypothetical protein
MCIVGMPRLLKREDVSEEEEISHNYINIAALVTYF